MPIHYPPTLRMCVCEHSSHTPLSPVLITFMTLLGAISFPVDNKGRARAFHAHPGNQLLVREAAGKPIRHPFVTVKLRPEHAGFCGQRSLEGWFGVLTAFIVVLNLGFRSCRVRGEVDEPFWASAETRRSRLTLTEGWGVGWGAPASILAGNNVGQSENTR